MSASATPPDAEIRLCRREMLRNDDVRTARQSDSRAAGRSAQSSKRRETKPASGAVANAATTYSIAFLSKGFCERSRNCKLFAYLTFQHIVKVTIVA
jgi:hypothetical protein